jgi:uncharacterized membrane protein
MNEAVMSFGIIYIIVGSISIIISVPLVLEMIPKNYFYGFRLPKAFLSDENWYKINKFGGEQLIIWSLPLIIMGILCLFAPLDLKNGDLLTVIPLLIFTFIPIIRTMIYANKL